MAHPVRVLDGPPAPFGPSFDPRRIAHLRRADIAEIVANLHDDGYRQALAGKVASYLADARHETWSDLDEVFSLGSQQAALWSRAGFDRHAALPLMMRTLAEAGAHPAVCRAFEAGASGASFSDLADTVVLG